MNNSNSNILETFITDLDQFESNLFKIGNAEPQKFLDKERLERFGIQSPNSMFYVSLFRSLGLINKEGKTTEDYLRFMQSEQSARIVFAEKIRTCYDEVFQIEKHAHKITKEKAREIFKKLLQDQKSDTFIRMIADTYKALVDFADFEGLEQSKKKKERGQKTAEPEVSKAHKEFIYELMNDAEHTYDFGKKDDAEIATSKVTPQKLHLTNNGDVSQLAEAALKKQTLRSPDLKSISSKNGELVASVMEKKANLLLKLERNEEAISTFDQILDEFAHSALNITEILLKKAELLEKMNQFERALSTYDSFLELAGSTEVKSTLLR